jgi:hypothetical protein
MARRSLHLPKKGERFCPRCNAYKSLSEFGAGGEDTYCRDHRKEARQKSRDRARMRDAFGPDVSKMSDAEFGEFVVWFMETNGEKDAAKRLRGGDYFIPD